MKIDLPKTVLAAITAASIEQQALAQENSSTEAAPEDRANAGVVERRETIIERTEKIIPPESPVPPAYPQAPTADAGVNPESPAAEGEGRTPQDIMAELRASLQTVEQIRQESEARNQEATRAEVQERAPAPTSPELPPYEPVSSYNTELKLTFGSLMQEEPSAAVHVGTEVSVFAFDHLKAETFVMGGEWDKSYIQAGGYIEPGLDFRGPANGPDDITVPMSAGLKLNVNGLDDHPAATGDVPAVWVDGYLQAGAEIPALSIKIPGSEVRQILQIEALVQADISLNEITQGVQVNDLIFKAGVSVPAAYAVSDDLTISPFVEFREQENLNGPLSRAGNDRELIIRAGLEFDIGEDAERKIYTREVRHQEEEFIKRQVEGLDQKQPAEPYVEAEQVTVKGTPENEQGVVR